MADDETGEEADYVLYAPAEEMADAGETILEALGRHDPQAEDELMANSGLERGLVVRAGRRLERDGRVAIEGDERDARMYWLPK